MAAWYKIVGIMRRQRLGAILARLAREGFSTSPSAERKRLEASRGPSACQWWLIAGALPIWLLASRLTLDFWEDEVYTLYDFAVLPISQIVSDYSAPNNHILYSLVLHPLAMLSQSEPLLRLPSLLFGVATLWIVFRIALRTLGAGAAVGATLALGLNVMFLTHAVQVRGYGLSILLAAWLLDRAIPETGADDARRLSLVPARWNGPHWRSASIAIGGAAFLYTIPTNVLFLAPLTIVALVLWWWQRASEKTPRWSSPLGWLLAWPLAFLAYWPVLAQVLAVGGAGQLPIWVSVLTSPIGDVYWAACHDLWPLGIALPVVIYRVVHSRRGAHTASAAAAHDAAARRATLAVCAAFLVGPFLLCAALGTAPFVRTFCPMLPALALAVGWYLSVMLQVASVLVGRRDARQALPWSSLIVAAVVLLPPVLRYPDKLDAVRTRRFAQDGYFNYYAADFEPSRVASYLQNSIHPGKDFLVLYADRDHYNLVHYLNLAKLPLPPNKLTADATGKVRAEVFCVVPELAHWDELAHIAGLRVEQLRSFPLVHRVGYYRVYASPQPVEWYLPPKRPR